jgi:hypothetical protein
MFTAQASRKSTNAGFCQRPRAAEGFDDGKAGGRVAGSDAGRLDSFNDGTPES